MNKKFFIEKILPILITSLLSAAIATLQTILTNYLGSQAPTPKIEDASAWGAIIGAVRAGITRRSA